MPIILAIWEAENRIAVPCQPRQKSLQELMSVEKELGMAAYNFSPEMAESIKQYCSSG
jgi:hypothetical protein